MIWLVLTLVALAAAAIVTRPWWAQRHTGSGADRRAANVTIYHERLAELERELSSGTIDASAFEEAQAELAQRLIDDAGQAPQAGDAQTAAARSGSVWPAAVILFLIPAVGLSLYALGGQWRQLEAPQPASHEQVDTLVQQLERRLAENPDPEGFVLLGRTYGSLGRYAESAESYARANRMTGDEVADWIAEEAEARALAARNNWRGPPAERLQRALQLAPEHPKALFYAGLAAIQGGDQVAAAGYWRRLLQQPELPADVRSALRARLDSLPDAPAPAAGEEAGPAPAVLKLRVDVAPALRDQAAGKTLFVFAKAADGPPMPLAVQRLNVESWPVDVRLDDSMAMMPSLRLSQFERWVVTARLSADGDAVANSGDLQTETTVEASSGDDRVDLTIDEVLQ